MRHCVRVIVQADQLNSPVGGGRFLRGLLGQLLGSGAQQRTGIKDALDIIMLCTQNEQVTAAGFANAPSAVLQRRFPSFLRGTSVESAWSLLLPSADVIYGSFSHVFPHRCAKRVVTVHDTTFLHPEYHGEARSAILTRAVSRTVAAADTVVCSSRSTERDILARWPHAVGKTRVVYGGVTVPSMAADGSPNSGPDSLLVVGTVEPRKNYGTVLRAYEVLRQRRPRDFPHLRVVGRLGWMSDHVARQLRALEEAGLCSWLSNADDSHLWTEYARCRVFTYLPFMEGFGFPPFEAAASGCPLVLSNRSSVGEIWGHSARCVDPSDVDAIVSGWEWALDLSESERQTVVARQRAVLERFSWEACSVAYAEAWREAAARS